MLRNPVERAYSGYQHVKRYNLKENLSFNDALDVSEERYSLDNSNKKIKNYYVSESVGIATGMLLTSLHLSGLVTLTHTPSPMNFLNTILKRPVNEKPFVLLVVGKPKDNCMIPVFATKKKSFNKISTIF